MVSSFVLSAKFGFARGFAHYEDDFDPDDASAVMSEWRGHDTSKGFDRRADATTRLGLLALGLIASARCATRVLRRRRS